MPSETRNQQQLAELDRLREQLAERERELAEERASAAARRAAEEEQQRLAQEEEERRLAAAQEEEELRRAAQLAEEQHPAEAAPQQQAAADVAASLAKLTELVTKQQQQIEAQRTAHQEEVRRLQEQVDDLHSRQPIGFPYVVEENPDTSWPLDSSRSNRVTILPGPALSILQALPPHCFEQGNLRTELAITFAVLGKWSDLEHHLLRLLHEYPTISEPADQVQFLAAGLQALFAPLDPDNPAATVPVAGSDDRVPLTFMNRGTYLLSLQYDSLQINPQSLEGRAARASLKLLTGLQPRQFKPATPIVQQALVASTAGATHAAFTDYFKSTIRSSDPSGKGSGKVNGSSKRSGSSQSKRTGGAASDPVNPASSSTAPTASNASNSARSGKSRSPSGRGGTHKGSSTVPASGTQPSSRAAQNAAQDP